MSHKKPRPDFPLTPTGNGQWSKVVNKRRYYFGSWRDDPLGVEAIKEWLANKDSILAGLYTPKTAKRKVEQAEGMTVERIIQDYREARIKDVTNGKLSPDTLRDYKHALNSFAAFIGVQAKAQALKPSDFTAWRGSIESTVGPHALKRMIASVRACFNYAMDMEWINPIRFGPAMKSPDTEAEAVAHHHEQHGAEAKTERLLTRREARKFMRLSKVRPKERAWFLLMLNAALNPAELARLKWSHINFKSGRLSRRRGKAKGIRLECYLWKTTRKALLALTRVEGQELIFVRQQGKSLVGSQMKDGKPVRWNKLTDRFIKLCKQIGLSGITPYTLRRTARTLAAHCQDDGAAKRMMGQRLPGRDQTYIKGPFPLKRLKRIAKAIYTRIFRCPSPKLRIAQDSQPHAA